MPRPRPPAPRRDASMAETATLSVTRGRLGLSWPLLIAIFGFAMTLATGPRVLADPDILWQVVTGNWILAHGAVPHAEIGRAHV